MKNLKYSNILPPTLLLALSALFSRLLGVVRDHMLARTFGATSGAGIYNLDAYYAAFRIPDLIYNLLIFGAISAAFIPIFTQYKKDGRLDSAWEFASGMLHIMVLGTLVLSGIMYVLAPYLVHLVAGGFGPEDSALTVKLMRILLLSPILMGISAVLISIQDSFKTFLYRSLGPLFYNLGIIAGIVYFGKTFGVVGVTWGVIIGAVLQLIIQLPALWQVHYKHRWLLGYSRQDVRRAFKLIIPRVLGLSLNQITLVINTLIASFLTTGSITIFYLSDNLQNLPIGIIGISFAITSFATFSELAAEESKEPFAREMKRVMQRVLFLIIPATAGMLILKNQIIDVILVAGKFTASDAALTRQVLACMLISLFAQSLIPLLSRGFYAHHNTKTPVFTALAGSAINIALSLILGIKLSLGIAGIAIAYSAGSILNFALLFAAMRRKLKFSIVDTKNLIKMIAAAAFMCLAVLAFLILLPFHGGTIRKIIFLLAASGIGAAIYLLLARALKIPEVKMFSKKI